MLGDHRLIDVVAVVANVPLHIDEEAAAEALVLRGSFGVAVALALLNAAAIVGRDFYFNADVRVVMLVPQRVEFGVAALEHGVVVAIADAVIHQLALAFKVQVGDEAHPVESVFIGADDRGLILDVIPQIRGNLAHPDASCGGSGAKIDTGKAAQTRISGGPPVKPVNDVLQRLPQRAAADLHRIKPVQGFFAPYSPLRPRRKLRGCWHVQPRLAGRVQLEIGRKVLILNLAQQIVAGNGHHPFLCRRMSGV